MPKEAPGRNDPCSCGSGKKYKKCCIARDQAKSPKVIEPPEHSGCSPHDHLRAGVVHVPEELTGAQAREYVERLDRWANAARDALDKGRLEEAESLSDQLRAEYPEQIDGYELRARVRLQQERWDEAAEGYEQAVAAALKHREDYDEEFIENLRRDAEHARAHAQGRDWKPAPLPPIHRVIDTNTELLSASPLRGSARILFPALGILSLRQGVSSNAGILFRFRFKERGSQHALRRGTGQDDRALPAIADEAGRRAIVRGPRR